MKLKKIALFLLTTAMVSEALSQETISHLSAQDQIIYNQTVAVCQSGSVSSAIELGFDKNNFISSLSNWLKITSLDYTASEQRIKGNGLSPAVSKLQHSQGFWLALTTCYGYEYGTLNYGNLMKQIIDMGHLTTESSSTIAGFVITTGGIKWSAQLAQKFPIVARFTYATLISAQVGSTINTLIDIYYPSLSKADLEALAQTKSIAFKEPDLAIQAVIAQANNAIKNIDLKLATENLSDQDKQMLILKKQKIQASLSDLIKLQITH